MKNRIDVKITPKEFSIISLMSDGWDIKRYGQRQGYLVESKDGVENFCQKNVTCIGVPTMKNLLKKKLIELDTRITWDKRYKLSKKGESILLSILN